MRMILFLVALFTSFSCSEKIEVTGHRIEEARSVESYDRLSVGNGFTVILRQEEQAQITIKTFSSVLPYVKSSVRGGTLYVELEDGVRFDENPDIIVTLPINGLRWVDFSGGVNARSSNGSIFSRNSAEIRLSGGSKFRGDVGSNSLNVQLSGGSEVELTGNAGSMNGNCSGGSSIRFQNTGTDFLKLELSGGSIARIMVNNKIEKVDLSGGSILYYEGTRIVEGVSVSGGSKLISQFD